MVKLALCLVCVLAVFEGETVARVVQDAQTYTSDLSNGVNQQNLPNQVTQQVKNCRPNETIHRTTSTVSSQGGQQSPGGSQYRRGSQQGIADLPAETIQQYGSTGGGQRRSSQQSTNGLTEPIQRYGSDIQQKTSSIESSTDSLPTEAMQQSGTRLQTRSVPETQITRQTGSVVSTSSESTEDLSNRPELQIINLCTQVPSYYEELVKEYATSNPSSAEDLQNIQSIESSLKTKTNQLRQFVNNYDESISQTDPEAKNIQALMTSAVDQLIRSVDQMNDSLNTEASQTSVADRVKAIEKFVRPAMVKFEEFCLLQTKDILKNVLQDYEASLLA